MGFYFRKSKSFGPFRLNLSKSGIGISTGVKGARLSIGPKGTYVNMGRNGMYYRKKIGSGGGKKSAKYNYVSNEYTPKQIKLDPNYNIGTTSYDKGSFESQVLKKIKNAKKYNKLWHVFFWISVFFGIGNPFIFIITALLIIARFVFRDSYITEINCDLEDDDKNAWNEFVETLKSIKESSRFWIINSVLETLDSKNNFGTSSNIERNTVTNYYSLAAGRLAPFRIKSSNVTFQINERNLKILFLPELMIISYKKDISLHTYNQFDISHSDIRFAENLTELPKDADVIEWKYQHITKDGSVDLRFKNNPKYPICKYGMLSFSSVTGLLIRFELSNSNISKNIADAFDKYVIALNTPITKTEVSSVKEEKDLKVIDSETDCPEKEIIPETDNDLINELRKYSKLEEN